MGEKETEELKNSIAIVEMSCLVNGKLNYASLFKIFSAVDMINKTTIIPINTKLLSLIYHDKI